MNTKVDREDAGTCFYGYDFDDIDIAREMLALPSETPEDMTFLEVILEEFESCRLYFFS